MESEALQAVHKLLVVFNTSYEDHVVIYFCRWIEACIEDELPPTTELEEALRNGVILGRLGHFYAPDILPLRKIYDRDQAKYHVGLQCIFTIYLRVYTYPCACIMYVRTCIRVSRLSM